MGADVDEVRTTHLHERLYHLFFVDLVAAIVELRKLFRHYAEERRLAEIEQLLDLATEAHQFLQLIAQSRSNQDGSSDDAPPENPSSTKDFWLMNVSALSIYLTMGDVAQASELFERLLMEDDNTLSRYRWAFIQTGLGESYLRQRLPQQARTHLEEALPILQEYDDIPTNYHACTRSVG